MEVATLQASIQRIRAAQDLLPSVKPITRLLQVSDGRKTRNVQRAIPHRSGAFRYASDLSFFDTIHHLASRI
jgi:hypothetical protein